MLEKKIFNVKLHRVKNESLLLEKDTESNHGTVSDHVNFMIPFH